MSDSTRQHWPLNGPGSRGMTLCRLPRLAVCIAGSCIAVLALAAPPDTNSTSAPSVDQIVARMVEADRANAPLLREYTSIRKYQLQNQRFGTKASMTVKMNFHYPGHKEFQVLDEQGSSAVRERVLHRMLDTETKTSGDGLRESTQVTPKNYSFEFAGTEDLDGRKSYVLEATPRTNSQYLFRGRVWVDAEDFAVAKIEGSPAKNPSFLIRRTTFVHKYAKFGPFWLAVSNHSVSDALLFGRTDVNIEYTDYRLNQEPATRASGGGAPEFGPGRP